MVFYANQRTSNLKMGKYPKTNVFFQLSSKLHTCELVNNSPSYWNLKRIFDQILTLYPTSALPSLLNDSFNIENDELLFPSNDSLLDGCADHLHIGNMTHHLHKATNLSEIPVKEIIIVLGMLGLWFYSIVLTRKAWYRILKE